MNSSQSPSLDEERHTSTTEPPIAVDVNAELSAPPPDPAPQPAPSNPTTPAPSTKSFELMEQVEALAHDVAVVSRRDSSDQRIKVQEGSNFSAGLPIVAPTIRVSPRNQFASDRPSISRRTLLALANFFIAARDQLVRPLFDKRIILAPANFFIAARDRLVRPLFGRRTSLTLADLFIAVLIGVAATFVWQFSTAKSPNVVAVAEKQSGFTPVGQASAPPQPAPVTQTAPAASPFGTSPEFVQQLETITRDLTALRRSVDELAAKQEHLAAAQEQLAAKQEHLAAAQEQLAAKQEQMAQAIAKPQAVKRNKTPKMASAPRGNAPPKHALSEPGPEPTPRPPSPVPTDRR